jgi:hypothetical protein
VWTAFIWLRIWSSNSELIAPEQGFYSIFTYPKHFSLHVTFFFLISKRKNYESKIIIVISRVIRKLQLLTSDREVQKPANLPKI